MPKKQPSANKTIVDTSKKVAERARQVTDKAKEITGISKLEREKAAIHKDVEELVAWVKQRSQDIEDGRGDTDSASMPTLAKVISGGEETIESLPEEERAIYAGYFKRNASRIALLTAINPIVGLGSAGAGLAASGAISTKEIAGITAAGAGIVGASAIASGLAPVSYYGWLAAKTFIPPLRLVGLGVFAFGTGAALFKSIEKIPIGKEIAAAFDQDQQKHNECIAKFESNINAMGQLLATKIKSTVDVLEDTSKKVAITIDDAIHSDQNMRIMQYQEIVLKQYNSQIQIRETLNELIESYNSLKAENKKLAKQIMEYQDNMQKLICGSEFLK